MDQRNLAFVNEVKKYPCLYNCEHSDYAKKEVVNQAWAEIGQKFNTTGNEVRRLWKNLRSAYTRHLRPNNFKTSKTYYLSDAMSFILPYSKYKNSTGDLIFRDGVAEDDSLFNDEPSSPESAASFMQIAMKSESGNCETTETYVTECNASETAFVDCTPLKNHKASFHITEENLNDTETTTTKDRLKNEPSQKRRKMPTNTVDRANKMFLLSLVPDLNEMNPTQLRFFKRKVLCLIDQILEVENLQE